MSDDGVSTDLAIPLSGELVDLTDARSAAVALERVRDAERDLKVAKGVLLDALRAEASRRGDPHVTLEGGVSYSVTDKTNISWDVEMLDRLLELGLPQERFDELVEVVVETKVNAVVAKQIAKMNPQYAAVISAARHDTPAGSEVKVTIQ